MMKYLLFRKSVFFILILVFVRSGVGVLAVSATGDAYAGILVPTADPASQPTVSGYLLAFPVGGVGRISFPITRRVTTSVYGGLSGYPAGLLGLASLRAHLVHPDSTRWGLAGQAQYGAATVLSGGEGTGGIVSGIALVASSPMKATRVSLGAALHTMPGSEFQPGWENAKDYDFKNPQPTFFVSGGHTFRKNTVFTELVWIAPGADEGWDSVIAGILGGEFSLGRAKLKVGTGLFVQKPGTINPRALPVPPIVVLAIPL